MVSDVGTHIDLSHTQLLANSQDDIPRVQTHVYCMYGRCKCTIRAFKPRLATWSFPAWNMHAWPYLKCFVWLASASTKGTKTNSGILARLQRNERQEPFSLFHQLPQSTMEASNRWYVCGMPFSVCNVCMCLCIYVDIHACMHACMPAWLPAWKSYLYYWEKTKDAKLQMGDISNSCSHSIAAE